MCRHKTSREPRRQFVAGCLRSGHFNWSPNDEEFYPAIQYWGLGAAVLGDIGAPLFSLHEAVARFQNDDGGFGKSTQSELWHTYSAVSILNKCKEVV
jgi:hypothetical protein